LLKNIGILEIHYHIKFLHTMMRICKTKNTTVTVFTTKELFSRIETYLDDKSKYKVILMDEKESISSFLKKVEEICNEKIDILFINTIQTSSLDLPHYFGFKPKTKMILTVHTTNHWLKAKFTFNSKNLFRTVDTNLSLIFIRKIILPKFDAINVIYPPIKNYILKNTDYKKEIFTIPFNFFDKSKKISNISNDNKIRFVIPGIIEDHRRDYKASLDVFEKLFKKFSKKISLYIVGRPIGAYGEEIIERCEKLKKKGYEVVCSKKFVSEKKYNENLTKCDIIFSPITVRKKGSTGIEEIYGTTEGSALPFEAIQYAKPLIAPKEFNIINELKSSSISYDNLDELEQLLTSIITDKKKLVELRKNALENSKKFSLSTLQKYFENNVLNIK